MEDSGLNTGHNFTKQTHSFGETDGLQNTHTHTREHSVGRQQSRRSHILTDVSHDLQSPGTTDLSNKKEFHYLFIASEMGRRVGSLAQNVSFVGTC